MLQKAKRRKGISHNISMILAITIIVAPTVGYMYSMGSFRGVLIPVTTTTTTSVHTTTTPTSTVKAVVIDSPKGSGSDQSINFSPSTITVVIGVNNTIVFRNLDSIPHTATTFTVPSGATQFDSGIKQEGQTYSLTLTVPGTYEYHCILHPGWMKGKIIVVAAAGR